MFKTFLLEKAAEKISSTVSIGAKLIPRLFISAGLIILVACEKTPEPTLVETNTTQSPILIQPETITAVNEVWPKAISHIQACSENTQNLRRLIGVLLANPNQQILAEVRKAWRHSHNQFHSLGIYFAVADSNPGLFGVLDNHLYQLDGQPIQPGFIDYFDVYSQSGIVNDMAIVLSAQALRQQHGITDASDISIGFHAMEYLLWGEQGERPITDFNSVTNLSSEQIQLGLKPVDIPNNRRRVYLQILAELLVDDCVALAQEWTDSNSALTINYQQLQTGSRLQLWQAAISTTVDEIVQLNNINIGTETESNISPEEDKPSEIDNSNEEVETELSNTDSQHNQFAQGQTELITAKLEGLSSLLFKHQGNNNEPLQSSAEDLSLWVLPGLQSETTTTESDASEPEQIVSNEALVQAFNDALTALNAESTWPLSETNQALLNRILDNLNSLLL